MEQQALLSISPVDGRYSKQLSHLSDYYSEYALIRYRVLVEAEYLLLLSEQNFFEWNEQAEKALRDLLNNFSVEDALAIKEIEQTTNHDVKAVEYFIRTKLEDAGAPASSLEFVHFGLTSQDVNNTAIPLLWKHSM